jgi:anion transporter
MDKKLVGIILGFLAAAVIWLLPIANLPEAGQKCLAITVFVVIWWVFGVMHPAYTTLLLFLGYIVLIGDVTAADGSTVSMTGQVFRLFTLPLGWLMIGAFLIAAAVTKSGLAKRISYFLMIRFARSYKSIIVLGYVLGLVLSFVIPHPFPRVLLIMAMLGQVIKEAKANEADTAALGFSVFAAATATAMVLLVGDSVLNVAGVGFSGENVGFIEWIKYMAVPGLIASVLMLLLNFAIFKQTGPFEINKEQIIEDQKKLGPMTRDEKVVGIWVLIALVLWSTDFIHHIDPAWVALMVAVGLALPYIGKVLTPGDIISGVNWPIVLFVVGALAIGSVGSATGMAQWLASTVLPANPPSNAFAFAGMIGGVTMLLHMILGSALACMSVVSPPMVNYAISAGWSPIVPALLVYTAVNMHYLLPFQHVTMLLGAGDTGKYGNKETLKYGIPLTLVCLIVMIGVMVPWWMLIGLIPT